MTGAAGLTRGSAGDTATRHRQAVLAAAVGAYLACIAHAESVVAFGNPVAGAIVDASLILLIVSHYVLLTEGPGAARATAEERRWVAVLPVLALLPMLRLTSVAMPLVELPERYWPMAVGAPVLVAAILVARTLGLTPALLGLRVGYWRAQLAIAAVGVPLGLVACLILRPEPPAGSLAQLGLHVAILVVFAALGEELIFRGLVQRVFDGFMGCPGLVWSTCLSALVYLGWQSGEYVAVVAAVGLLFGWCVHRTGSIVGVAAAHGLLVVGLVVAWPHVLPTADTTKGDRGALAPGARVPNAPLADRRDVAPVEFRRPMQPLPIVRIAAQPTRSGARIAWLTVQAPRGADVRVGCTGRGCPPIPLVMRATSFAAQRLALFERWLPAGARIRIVIRQPGRIGRVTSILVRKQKQSLRTDESVSPTR